MTTLDDAHAALHRAVASDGGVAVVGLSVAQAGALLDEAARLVAERDGARRERDLRLLRIRALTEDRRAIRRERDETRAVLGRLRAWCRRPEWAAQAVLARVHGQVVADEVAAEGRALWADVDRLLGEETTEG